VVVAWLGYVSPSCEIHGSRHPTLLIGRQVANVQHYLLHVRFPTFNIT